jgi:hypothetical protein
MNYKKNLLFLGVLYEDPHLQISASKKGEVERNAPLLR